MSKTKIQPVVIHQEIKSRFLSYAMSVIIARALPLVDDGLKPVHRRILYAMYGLKLFHDKQYKKSARVVGEVIGKYHPHGDAAVYEAITKMIQSFATNNPLIDGHGNFGSIDGDAPAAMRYTEIRLSPLANTILEGLNHNTVDFAPNYDGSEKEPVVLPGLFPTLLVNGSIGIAVGMATSIPPHNLGEVVDTTIAYLDNPEITVEEIVARKLLCGPDFPTGAYLINDDDNLTKVLKTGRGSYKIRAKYHLDKVGNNPQIIIDEIPYQINKTKLMQNIVDLVKVKKLNDVAELRDESNRLGIRLVITLKKEAQTDIALNQLFKLTDLQTNFSVNLLALHRNKPQVMGLLTVLRCYVAHQIDVLNRETRHLLQEDEKKLMILVAIAKALADIDKVVALIRQAQQPKEAIIALTTFLSINSEQAKAILDIRLQRLTSLERDKVQNDINQLNRNIIKYKGILQSPTRQKTILKQKLSRLKTKYAKPRQTIIKETDEFANLTADQLVLHEDVLVCITENNYLKRVNLNYFRQQKRGGVGVKGISLYEGDRIKQVLFADTHDNLLFFTNLGKVYQLKTWKVPNLKREAKGVPAQNLINIAPENEKIENVIRSTTNQQISSLFFVTKKGLVKQTLMSQFNSINRTGKIAIKLNPEDRLKFIFPVAQNYSVIIGKSDNKIVHFQVKQVPIVGRTAKGVIGTRLSNEKKDSVVGASFALPEQKILSITNDGCGKLTDLSHYRVTARGTKGTNAVKGSFVLSKKLISTIAVKGDENLLIAKSNGKFIISSLQDTRVTKSRSAKGVKLVNLEPNEKMITASILDLDLNKPNTDSKN